MVGRPGRSKGCITCKKRKVKCDEGRPLCRRCQDAYMICEGYATAPNSNLFIDETGRFATAQDTSKPSIITQHTACHETLNPAVPPVLDIARATYPITPSPPPGLDLRAYRENLWVSFMTTCVLTGADYSLPPGITSWVIHAIQLDTTSVVFYSACCLSAALFARTHKTPDADLKYSACYYEKALRQLKNNLADTVRWRDAANVAATLLLGMYELTVFAHGNGWIRHAGGAGKLIQMRGAEASTDYPARFYCKMSHSQVVLEALVFRRKTFLENPEWQNIAATSPNEQLRLSSQIWSLLARTPGLLEQCDSIREAEDAGAALFKLQYRIVAILADFFQWRWDIEREFPNLAYEVEANPFNLVVDAAGKPLFDSMLYYHHYYRAVEVVRYDTGLLVILEIAKHCRFAGCVEEALQLLEERNITPPHHTNPLLMPHADLDIPAVVLEICRSTEYLMQGGLQLNAAFQLLFPLRTVSRHMHDPCQLSWLQGLITQISTVSGIHFANRILDFRSIAED